MDQLQGLALVGAAVFAVNLLPAFGPPTWAVLVLFSLHLDPATVPLIVTGAVAAAGGRLLLAVGTRRLAGHIPEKQRSNLRAAGELVERRRGSSAAFLALFTLSPLPSAQLFEAAGLMSTRLVPLTVAFFAGRIVSYSIYVGGASALHQSDTGKVLLSSLTSPWALTAEVLMLILLTLLAKVDWVKRAERGSGPATPGEPSGRRAASQR